MKRRVTSKRKTARPPRPYWFVTPMSGASRNIKTEAALVNYVKRHPNSLVSWVRDER